MAYEPKPNSLSVFKNDRQRNDKDAAYTGTLYLEDDNGNIVEYFVDLWVNEIRNGQKAGQKYFGGRVKRKEKQPGMADSYGDRDRPLGEQQRSMSYNNPPKRGIGPSDYTGPSEPRRGEDQGYNKPLEDEIPF